MTEKHYILQSIQTGEYVQEMKSPEWQFFTKDITKARLMDKSSAIAVTRSSAHSYIRHTVLIDPETFNHV